MKQKFSSFSRRLTRRLMLGLALTLIIINAGIFTLSDRAMIKMVDVTFHSLLELESQSLQLMLSQVDIASRNIIDDVEMNIDNPDKVAQILTGDLKSNPKIKGFFVAFEPNYYPEKGQWCELYAVWRDGKIVTMQLGSEKHNYLEAEWYQKAINSKKSYWSEPYFDKDGAREMLCTLARPVLDKQGRRVGVFGADVSLEWLHKKLRKFDNKTNVEHIGLKPEQSERRGSYCFIIGKGGNYIAHPEKDRVLVNNIFDEVRSTKDTLDDKLAADMTSGKVGCNEVKIDGKQAYVFYSPVEHTDWTMGFYVPKSVMKSHVVFFNILILLAMVLGLFSVYWICRITIRHATKPLHVLAKSADEVAQGNFNAPLPHLRHNDEIFQLRESFEHMQQSLAAYIDELKTTTAEKAAMESELNIAKEIQIAMLPANFPVRNDVSIYGSVKPAKAVGGDLFDFFFRGDNLIFCFGDVMGKGMAAAMLMTVTISLFRAFAVDDDQPDAIVSRINKAMVEGGEVDSFVTLFVGILHLPTGKLRYCIAGHEPPLLITDDITSLPYDPVFPVGTFSQTVYQTKEITLEPGAMLFLYTDGLNEAQLTVDNMFGKERVHDVARTAIDDPNPERLVRRMTEAVEAFVGDAEQSDDLTMLAIRRLPTNTITLKADASEYPHMTAFIKSLIKERHLDNRLAGRLRLTVEEAVGNIIDYSGASAFTLTVADSDGHLCITITDDGMPFNPLTAPEPDLSLSPDERQIGGLGIVYMRKMSDSIDYHRIDNKNQLEIRLKNE